MPSALFTPRIGVLVLCLLAVWAGSMSADDIAWPAPAESAVDSFANGDTAAGDGSLWGVLALYSVLIVGASLFGGWLPGHVPVSHVQFQLVLSLIGGLILGIGVLHLLPHAVHTLGPHSIDRVALWMMTGMLLMFFLLRTFHVHHHEPQPVEEPGEHAHALPVVEDSHDHGPHCQHDHTPQGDLSWVGIVFGLAIHTLLDGLALGATMQAEALHGATGFVGLGILLAIAVHQPLDSLSFTTLMMGAGQPVRRRWMLNAAYALLCPIGASLYLLGVNALGGAAHPFVGYSLAFSAGVFVCISLADLLPEMEFHSHHRVQFSIALLLGILLAWGIGYLEPAHLHGAGPESVPPVIRIP